MPGYQHVDVGFVAPGVTHHQQPCVPERKDEWLALVTELIGRCFTFDRPASGRVDEADVK